MAKKVYTAQTPIVHDGARFEIGEPLELDDEHAEPLLACGAVLPKGKPTKSKDGDGGDA